MTYQKHCPGCYVDKHQTPVCPYCGYDESAPRSRLFLPHGIIIGGQYRVGKVLGKPGGFGITYLGWDVNLQQRVAIKEFLPRDICARAEDSMDVTVHTEHDRPGFDSGKEQFLREARIVAKFDHPNIVRVRSFFNGNGTAYLVMDYYEGMSLGDYLTNVRRSLDASIAVPLMMPVLEGLDYVHQRGVTHRDVKPANIYLAAIGKPILLDFGAARQAAAGDLARSMSVVLTEGYAPLEQYQRRTPQGPWTDVYGLAATLYRMITGHIPPAALDRLGNDPLAQSNFVGLSETLRTVMAKALAVKPGDRYQNAGEFKQALQAALNLPVTGGASPSDGDTPASDASRPPPTPPPAKLPPARVVTLPPPAGPKPLPLPRVLAEPSGSDAGPAAGLGQRRPLSASTVLAGLTAGALAILALIMLTYTPDPDPLAPVELAVEPAAALSTAPAVAAQVPAQLPAGIPVLLPEMTAVPGGEFLMGDDKGRDNERPAHRIQIIAFKISRSEITVDQFRDFVTRTQYDNPRWRNYPCESAGGRLPDWQSPGYSQRGDYPVVCVSWEDARAYTQWLSRETGQRFRLPTEAEWEYAARAGTRSAVWWGENFQEGYANCAGCAPIRNAPAAVRSYLANPLGLYEINGNVREWTCSMYAPYGSGAEEQCGTPVAESLATLRGGSWQEPVDALRAAYRVGFEPYRRNVWTGMRVVQELRAN